MTDVEFGWYLRGRSEAATSMLRMVQAGDTAGALDLEDFASGEYYNWHLRQLEENEELA